MTMRVISNEVRDPSLIPFSKESTKDTKVSDISASQCRGLRGEFRKGRHRGLPPKAVKREFFSSFGRFALKSSLLRALRITIVKNLRDPRKYSGPEFLPPSRKGAKVMGKGQKLL